MPVAASATRSLRSQVLVTILAVAVAAVILFAAPLAWLFAHTFRDDQVVTLEQEATRVAAALPDRDLLPTDELPAPLDRAVSLAVYAPGGQLITGTGPAMNPQARRAIEQGEAVTSEANGALEVDVPSRGESGTEVVVRAATSLDAVERRTYVAWAVLAGLSLGVLGMAALLAVWRARALSRPFEQLAASAHDLGEGAFALHVPSTGVREAEDVARALESSARRLGDRVAREQRFAEDASHQLKSPLTAARLDLESALEDPSIGRDVVLAEALVQVDRMESTIEELLRLSRGLETTASCDVSLVISRAIDPWRPRAARSGRALAVSLEPGLPVAAAPESAVRQILDVLVDNAITHGAGSIEVRARDLAGAVAIDVSDEGSVRSDVLETMWERGASGTQSTGIGLSLARDLADAEGGRLRLTSPGHPTVFTLVLLSPAEDTA